MENLPSNDEVVQMISQLLVPDTTTVTGATAFFKKYLERIESVEVILTILITHENDSIRHWAGILLTKRLTLHWNDLPEEVKNKIKNILLERLITEPVFPIKKSIALNIQLLCDIVLPNNEWSDLFSSLANLTSHENSRVREIALVTIGMVSEKHDYYLRPDFTGLSTLYKKCLEDPEAGVRVECVRAIGAIVGSLQDQAECMQFQDLIDKILAGIETAVETGNDEVVSFMFQIFGDVVESRVPFLSTRLLEVTAFAIDRIVLNAELNIGVRELACDYLESLAANKKGFFSKNISIMEKVIETCFRLAMETGLDLVSSEDEDVSSPSDMGFRLIDCLACNLSNKHFYPRALKLIEQCVTNDDPLARKNGMLAMGYISQGCEDPMKENLAQIVDVMVRGCNDSNDVVRTAAALSIGFMAENLLPDMINYHKEILPTVITFLDDSNEYVISKAAFAIDRFCDHLDKNEIKLYVDSALPKLMNLINIAPPKTKVRAVTALASIISAMGSKFTPFFKDTIEKLAILCNLQNAEEIDVRAAAIECAGHLANSVGKATIEPYISTLAGYAMAGLQLTGDEIPQSNLYALKESGFTFFSNLSEVLGEDFTPYLEHLIPIVHTSALSDSGIQKQNKKAVEFSLDSDSEDEGEFAGMVVATPFLDEKSAAVHALGVFALHCPRGFFSHMESSMETLEKLWDYFHENIREQLLITYHHFVMSLVKYGQPDGKFPKYSKGFPAQTPLPSDAETLLTTTVMPKFFDTLQTDSNKSVIGQVCFSLEELTQKLGPAVLEGHLANIMEHLDMLLKEKALCQKIDSDEEEDDDEDHDEVILGSVTDLLISIIKVSGETFSNYFKDLLPALNRYTKPSRPASDKTAVMGVLAEAINCMPSYMSQHAEYILQSALTFMEEGNEGLSRNCCYTLGCICELFNDKATPFYAQILAAMGKVFACKDQEAKDNAVSAAARMVCAAPTALPLEDCVNSILTNIPLTGDYEETGAVVRFIVLFSKEKPELLANHKENILKTLCYALLPERTGESCVHYETDVVALFKQMSADADTQSLAESIVGSFDEDEQAIIKTKFN